MEEYYNTNEEGGDELAHSQAHARDQKLRVLAFFQAHPGILYAPHEINLRVLPEAPLTSVRRAITNLTTEGHLEKTSNMQQGTFGKHVHRWRLREPERQLAPTVPTESPLLAAARARLARR